ncbi:MAG: peptidoglycan DD-metalloendopeptidase family protein [Treponemataceae bacterium]
MEIINFVTSDISALQQKKKILQKKIKIYTKRHSSFSQNAVQSKQMYQSENNPNFYFLDNFEVQDEQVAFNSDAQINYLPNIVIAMLLCSLTMLVAFFYTLQIDSKATRLYLTSVIEKEDKNLLNEALSRFITGKTKLDELDSAGDAEESTASIKDFFQEPVTYQTYYVRNGDNITNIAKRFGLANISTLIGINQIERARSLQRGQKLIIPSIDGLFHHIARNETVITIAAKYNIPVETLVDVNDLRSENLKIGEALFIPGARLNPNDLKKALGELFRMPLLRFSRVSSPYGWRADPFTGARSFHTGVDLVAPQGTSIKASSDGKVVFAGWSNVYGNYVILNHGGGYQTLYAHMLRISVRKGQSVAQGSQVGLVGNTGYSTGAHLHFTVYKNGKTINPYQVLK